MGGPAGDSLNIHSAAAYACTIRLWSCSAAARPPRMPCPAARYARSRAPPTHARRTVAPAPPAPALGGCGLGPSPGGGPSRSKPAAPYAPEMAPIARLNECARANGRTPPGRPPEISLGDPRRADPEKLKTVLRHPVL